jgi:hypothetical protein
MTIFKLRGKSYPIEVTGTLGNKIDACLKNQFKSPEDDAIAAYVVSRACPSIPPTMASYKNNEEFNWTLSDKDFVIFSGYFSLALLEKQLEETTVSTEKAIISERIKSIKSRIDTAESSMNRAIAAGLLEEVEKLNLAEIDQPIEVEAVQSLDDEEATLRLKLEKLQASKKI